MALEEVGPRRKLAHSMAAGGNFFAAAQLAHAHKRRVPGEEGLRSNLQVVHDFLATARRDRMHQKRRNAQNEEAVHKHLTTGVGVIRRLRSLDTVGPVFVSPADEVVHQIHDGMQLGAMHDALVLGHRFMSAVHNRLVHFADRHHAFEILLSLVERRLDNVVYRLGFASTRREARQLVNHGHYTVNGKSVNIPSYLVDVNDVIAVSEKSSSNNRFKKMKEDDAFVAAPKWLERDKNNLTGKVIALPARDDIDFEIAENLIVELYSK